jgi:hypothetical protein
MNIPTIGRIVTYKTTEDDRAKMISIPNCNVQNELPAIIVKAWGETEDSCVNLKVLLDGQGDIWKTSAGRGDGEGNWNWPVKK